MIGQDNRSLRIGVAGLGTVGQGLLRLIARRPDFVPGGGRVEVTAVSARRRGAVRSVDTSQMAWFDDPVALARCPDIDVFVELVGGSEGVARQAVTAALESGKAVVTANKALIAQHGAELAHFAESRGLALRFEAAVMGGVPAVKILREALVGDEIEAVAGILNGTSNYILTEMEASGLDFDRILAQAQTLGYAEADPAADIGGWDAGHKIAILAALAFGGAPEGSRVEVEGIESVELIDIRLAGALGFRIKLIAMARKGRDGVRVSVHPTLIPLDHPLARAAGALNALFIHGAEVGELFIQGPGAGAGPTAAAVAADIADVIANPKRPVFQSPAMSLGQGTGPRPAREREGVYIRLMVRDEPGVVAAISETLAEGGVSIDSFLQKRLEDVTSVPIVLTTHPAEAAAITGTLARLAALPCMTQSPRLMRLARI